MTSRANCKLLQRWGNFAEEQPLIFSYFLISACNYIIAQAKEPANNVLTYQLANLAAHDGILI